MAQPTTDQRGRLLKELASEVKKLRGWAASDESVAERLTDALNELTAQRLLAHQFVAAVEDAQDALTRANKLVAAHGAVGPFTPIDDGVRFFTATTHLAVTQAGAGHAALGGQMATALRGWVGLLPHVDLVPYVGARAATWLLMAQARAALASGDVGRANAFADAAAARAREGGLGSGEDASLLVDALSLAAEARWVAGVAHDAVALSREASDAAAAVAAPVLDGVGRVAGAWAERVLAPLVAARRDLADRLLASGDVEAGLGERRALVDLLVRQAPRLGAPAKDALARSLADLSHDLMTLDRDDDALQVAGRAAEAAGDLAASEATVGAHLGSQFAAVTVLAKALVRQGEPEEAAEALASLFDRYASLRRPAGFEAGLAGATLVRAEVERASGDHEASERSLREFNRFVTGLRDASPGDKGLYVDVPGEVFARDRFRGVATRSPLPTPSWSNLSDADSLAAATRGALAVPAPEAPVEEVRAPVAEPAEAPVREPEPEPMAEPVEAPAWEPEPVVEPEPEPVEVEPEPVWEPEPEPMAEPVWEPEPVGEPIEAPVWEPEPVDEPLGTPVAEPVEAPIAGEPEPEPAAAPARTPTWEPEPQPAASGPSELELAQTALASAKASGNRRDTLAAAQVVVDALRPLVAADAHTWGRDLVNALEDLGEAKFRAGDWWGSRAPKKEAKQLAKEWGL